MAHQHHRTLRRFGARAEENCFCVLYGRQCHESLEQLSAALLWERIGCGEFAGGGVADGVADCWMRVTGIRQDNAAGEVDPLVAETIAHQESLGLIPEYLRHSRHRSGFHTAQLLDNGDRFRCRNRSLDAAPPRLDRLCRHRYQTSGFKGHRWFPWEFFLLFLVCDRSPFCSSFRTQSAQVGACGFLSEIQSARP